MKILNNIIEFSGELIGLNSDAIKELVESSQWVKRASVKKVLPSTFAE